MEDRGYECSDEDINTVKQTILDSFNDNSSIENEDNGYVILGDKYKGLIFQWFGYPIINSGENNNVIYQNFVISFPNKCLGVAVTQTSSYINGAISYNIEYAQVLRYDNNGVNVGPVLINPASGHGTNANLDMVRYLAIGY